MRTPPFELHTPKNLEEALTTAGELADAGQDFDWIAGGTDLLPLADEMGISRSTFGGHLHEADDDCTTATGSQTHEGTEGRLPALIVANPFNKTARSNVLQPTEQKLSYRLYYCHHPNHPNQSDFHRFQYRLWPWSLQRQCSRCLAKLGRLRELGRHLPF